MALEEEMKLEIKRIKDEIKDLDIKLDQMHDKVSNMLSLRRKKCRDLTTLKSNFEPMSDELKIKEKQVSLARIIK